MRPIARSRLRVIPSGAAWSVCLFGTSTRPTNASSPKRIVNASARHVVSARSGSPSGATRRAPPNAATRTGSASGRSDFRSASAITAANAAAVSFATGRPSAIGFALAFRPALPAVSAFFTRSAANADSASSTITSAPPCVSFTASAVGSPGRAGPIERRRKNVHSPDTASSRARNRARSMAPLTKRRTCPSRSPSNRPSESRAVHGKGRAGTFNRRRSSGSTRMMRGILREVSEDGRVFLRARELPRRDDQEDAERHRHEPPR